MEQADAFPLGSALVIVADPRAAYWARVHVTGALSAWGLDGEVISSAKLLASELVTNAVKASGANVTDHESTPESSARVALRLRLGDEVLRIAVWDGNPRQPMARAAVADDETGRGLMVIAALAKQWDFHPSDGGKVVWCDIGTGG